MIAEHPQIIVVTRDLAIAHAAALAAPAEWTEWCQGFSSALMAIGSATKLLIFDGAMDAPLSRLLPTVFVDQRPGRRAIVLQPRGAPPMPAHDERITMLSWPVAFDELARAIDSSAALTSCLEVELIPTTIDDLAA